MKILALSQDISLLNVIDYILYKDYKIIKSTSFENLDVELSSFDLLIIDLPYWKSNTNIYNVLKGYSSIPLILLTEDKNSSLISALKEDFYVKAVLKEPLSKKELKENVKDLTKKKKNKKDKEKERNDDKSDLFFTSPLQELVNNNDIVYFRINDLQDKKIDYISDNYKTSLGVENYISTLKELSGEIENPSVSHSEPSYTITYKLVSSGEFKIIKESGTGIFDSSKYLKFVEGYLEDYTNEYVESSFQRLIYKFYSLELISESPSEFIRKVIYEFAQSVPKELFQLSISFSGKDYLTNDFIPTDFLVSTEIISSGKRLGEVLLFSLNNDFDQKLKDFGKFLSDLILFSHQRDKDIFDLKNENERLKQDNSILKNTLAQAEAAFKDKASSYDNLNELFNAAMKDYKSVSNKLNRSTVVFETNSEGKIISANENYYRASGTDKAGIVGRYFDDLFENLNWQNFQFEFFNNSNQEISLKQKNKEGKNFYFSFYVSREENNNEYKFVFYGKDKSEARKFEIELGKQINEYNTKVNELIDSKKTNEVLWGELNSLKEELKEKEELIKKQEKRILKLQEREGKIALLPKIEENKENKLDTPQAEVKFAEELKEKIEEAKEEIEIEEAEDDSIFKNLRGIDSNIGLQNALGNMDTYNEILINFENDYLGFVKSVKDLYLINDYNTIQSKLSTLSEEAKYIGAEDLEKSAQLFRDKLSENKITNFDFELSVLGVHLNFTLDSIRKYKEDYEIYEQNNPKAEMETEQVIEKLEIEAESEPHEEIFDTFTIESEQISSEDVATEKEHKIEEAIDEKEHLKLEETPEEVLTEENKELVIYQNEIVVNEEIMEIGEKGTKEEPDLVIEEKYEEKELSPFENSINGLKNLINENAEISVIKEKLFALKFQNSDFSKIEKIELLESSIENNSFPQALYILDELKS